MILAASEHMNAFTPYLNIIPVAVLALVGYVGRSLHQSIGKITTNVEAVRREVLETDDAGKTLRQRVFNTEQLVTTELRHNSGGSIKDQVRQIKTGVDDARGLAKTAADKADVAAKEAGTAAQEASSAAAKADTAATNAATAATNAADATAKVASGVAVNKENTRRIETKMDGLETASRGRDNSIEAKLDGHVETSDAVQKIWKDALANQGISAPPDAL